MVLDSQEFVKKCLRGRRPPCSCACPVNLDLREFMGKMKKGQVDSAYKILSDGLVFPGITTEICGEHCRGECCANISILQIEKACLSLTNKREPTRYVLPRKPRKVAIVGGGLSGMACAYRLSARSYAVTVFDICDMPGGSLKEILDEELYSAEFQRQMKYCRTYSFVGGTKIQSLKELEEYDAIYLATGRGGSHFDVLNSWNEQSMATAQRGVFLGGQITGVGHMEALSHGILAAASIQNYLNVGSMEGMPGSEREKKSALPPIVAKNTTPILSKNGNIYDLDEAVAEAERCVLCDCTACIERCEYLKSFQLFSAKGAAETADKSLVKGVKRRSGARAVFSCMACDGCKAVCPQGLSLEPLMLERKAQLREMGSFAPQLHDYFTRDMEDSLRKDFLLRAPKNAETAGYLFFPGCQLNGSMPDVVEKAYGYLLKNHPDTGIMLGCCGIPAIWAGERQRFSEIRRQIMEGWESLGKPIMVTVCATCHKTFSREFPEIPCKSIYEILANEGLPEYAHSISETVAVFDPCASRDYSEVRCAVRELTVALDGVIHELDHGGDCVSCCGMSGHIYATEQKIVTDTLKNAAQLSEEPYIVWCANCRNLFTSVGKANRHILEYVFAAERANELHIHDIRKNRERLKNRILAKFFGEGSNDVCDEKRIHLHMGNAVRNQLDQKLISCEEIEQVIQFCEETGRKVWLPEKNCFAGHKKIGFITYWAEYQVVNENSAEVLRAYSHKTEIVEDEE